MQTTLLGLAIAIILALVAALIAPLVIDWSRYRSVFEEEAGRLTGLVVRVNGRIDASILPTPRIKLRNVEIGAPGREPQVRAGIVEVEVGLGPLLQGQVRATQVRVIAPQIRVGLDHSGAIDWPAASPTLRADSLSIAHLDVEDGRVVLSDAGSGARLVLQKLWFNGDIRSLAGPFAGEGAFVAGDRLYGYRISGSRADEDGPLKLKLDLDPSDQPLTAEIDGTLSFARGVPQFDGTLAMARPAAAALARGKRVMSDPWHLLGKLQATPAALSLHDLALQYGPEERAGEFSGKAEMTLGRHPHLDGAVTARQLDVDRMLAEPDVTRRPPFLVIKSFLEAFVAAVKPPLPVAVGVKVDALTIGGTAIQSLHGNIRFDDRGWSLDGVDFRAPGFTEVKVSGRLTGAEHGLAFTGPASLESDDLKTLMGWVEGRGETPAGATEPLTAQGVVTLASGRFAVEGLTATLDQESVQGRLAYTWAAQNHPAMLDGELHAAEIDVDALIAFAKAATSDGALELPHQVALALDIGKAKLAGVEARSVNAKVKLDAGVLRIDSLAVGDLGGTALDVSGRIDELSSQPRGRVTFKLDATSLAGLSAVVGKFAPQPAEWFRRFADRLAPAKIHGALTVDHATAGAVVKLDLAGDVGALHIGLDGAAEGAPSDPGKAVLRIDGKLDADDGNALMRLFGLDGVVAVDQLPGRLTISAAGPLAGDLRLDGLATAGGFSALVGGVLHVAGAQGPTAKLKVKASAGDLLPLQRAMIRQTGTAATAGAAGSAAVAMTASGTVDVTGAKLSCTDLTVAVGKSSLHGRLALELSSPLKIDGDIAADHIDAAAVAALLLGLPGPGPGPGLASAAGAGARGWSAEPLGIGAFAAVNGAVTVKLDRAELTPALVVRNLKGVLQFQPAQLALRGIDGSLAGGRLSGELAFRRDADKLAAQGQIELAGANAATILVAGKNTVAGVLTVKLAGDSMGRSLDGLVGALHGSGTIALADARFDGIDASAFDAALRATDPAGTIDAGKIRAAVNAAMTNGQLAVPRGEAEVTITGGQLRLANAALQAERGATLSLTGILDLNDEAIDARMTLSAPPAANALISARPELAVTVKGPLAAPQRTLDIAALVSWLSLRAAELQTRRLESVEADRQAEALSAAVRPAPPAVHLVPAGAALESAMQSNMAAGATPTARSFERLLPEPTAATPQQGPPDTGSVDRDAASAAAVPAPAAAKPAAPPVAAAPAAPSLNSLLKFLFRSQN